jgi:Reverse transcriptase (RNA-dependent DNA polymerase)
MHISRDVQVNEEAMWDWSTMMEICHEKIRDEIHTPMSISCNNNEDVPPITSHEASSSDDETRTPKTRSIHDLYEATSELYLVCLLAQGDNISFEGAIKDDKWRAAMDDEIRAIEKNDTWELTSLLRGHKAISVKWVYKKKMNHQGEVEKYKAILVVKGYKQQAGVDYEEVFAPVARMETIRLLIALEAQSKWHIYQIDVKSTFLNGVLEEEVYIEQPLGYLKEGGESKVLKLKNVLYGLKQAPGAWNTRIDQYFKSHDFVQCPYEHTLYVNIENGDMLIVSLYVDDLIFMGSSGAMIDEFKRAMKKEFEMTDLGLMSYFLGLEIKQGDEGIFVSQEVYAKGNLKRFNMEDCKSVSTPVDYGVKLSRYDKGKVVDVTLYKSLVGSLRYLTCTRPDILYVVGLVSRYMEEPRSMHWKTIK